MPGTTTATNGIDVPRLPDWSAGLSRGAQRFVRETIGRVRRAGGPVQLDQEHRAHAVVEPSIRDLKRGAGLNHCPSGVFNANAAWLLATTLAHNLIRWTQLIGAPDPRATAHHPHAHVTHRPPVTRSGGRASLPEEQKVATALDRQRFRKSTRHRRLPARPRPGPTKSITRSDR